MDKGDFSACDVAVLGGGGVARWVTDCLAGSPGRLRIRMCVRNPARAPTVAHSAPVDLRAVDADDPDALARAVAGARVVVNCLGPSSRYALPVARAAGQQGAHLVDTSGDEWEQRELRSDSIFATSTALLGAGLMPGLTAVLVRNVLSGAQGGTVEVYVGGRDAFTAVAASDFLEPAGDSVSQIRMASWRDGQPCEGPAPSRALEIPYFPEVVCGVAHLAPEVMRLVVSHRLDAMTAWTVFADERLFDAVLAARTTSDAREIENRASMSLFAAPPYQNVVVVRTEGNHRRIGYVLGRGASWLTGRFAAAATLEVLDDRLPVGIHIAGEVMDPAAALERLAADPAVVVGRYEHERAGDSGDLGDLMEQGSL